ncbi:MAG TPA: hypothetical protein P5243_02855 [Bacteroidales bacterium]|jgi:predicted transcriptional regulator|nr:hypothetical protein [Bacteroidales bacterium]HRS18419.1 hypothetical protein [Bacteroidales bacterium]
MIALSLISENYIPLKDTDSEKIAYDSMFNTRLFHLPVIDENNMFLGMLCEEDISNKPSNSLLLKDIQPKLIQTKVYAHQHIYDIIEKTFNQELSCIAVVDDNNTYLGLIPCSTLTKYFANITSLQQPGAIIVLEMHTKDYTLQKITQIIEENSAKIISLYTTIIPDSTKIELTIKLNTHDIGEIIAELNRFDYTIKTYFEGYSKLHELYKNRIDNLTHYLNI